MIAEWIEHARLRLPRHVRAMGYGRESIAIRARYRRHAKAWRLHREQTQGVIMKAAERCRGKGKVVVMGSGLLLDIPLAGLAERFACVVLVDIVHLPQVRKEVRAYPPVEIVTADIAAVAAPMYALAAALRAGRGPLPLPVSRPRPVPPWADADLVVSANLLSQLPLTPVAWLEQQLGRKMPYAEAGLEAFKAQVQRAHIDLLVATARDVCLVTDVASIYRDRHGNEMERVPLLDRAVLPPADEGEMRRWEWAMAPRGEFSRRYSVNREVVGIITTGG